MDETVDQTELFTQKETKLQLAFDKFHAENPHVYEWLLEKARIAKSRGKKHYSMRFLLGFFRWHTEMETNDPMFKINDHHSPYYSRLIMAEHPEFEGFFQMRSLTAE